MRVKANKWNNIMMCSDSFSVLKQISNPGPKYNEDWYCTTIKYIIRNLTASGKKIKLIWIPFHSGIIQNEKVEQVTKSSNNHKQVSTFAIPIRDIVAPLYKDIIV